MDSNELNKIAGGVIGALLVFLLLAFMSRTIYSSGDAHHHGEQTLAFALDIEEEVEEVAEEEVDPQVLLAGLVADADPAAGEAVYNKCRACHKIEDGANAVGPHLWNVVGREIAAIDGYAYSDSLSGVDGAWDVPALMAWLENTNDVASGNKMGNSAAISDPADRMNLIAYLNQSGDAPVDLAVSAGVDGMSDEAAAADEAVTEETEVAAADPVATEEAAVEEAAVEEAADAATEEAAPIEPIELMDEAEAAIAAAPAAEAREEEAEAAAAEEAAEAEAPAPSEAAEDATTEAVATEEEATEVAVADTAAEPEVAEPEAAPASDSAYAGLLAQASVDAGKRVYNKCRACHQVRDGRNGVGPHLYGVVGREIAAVDGYRYSDALSGKDGAWGLDNMMAWLENPTGWAPGTKMNYALRDEMERINVIVYLNSLTDEPVALE